MRPEKCSSFLNESCDERVVLQTFVSLDAYAAGANNSVDFVPASMKGDRCFGSEQIALKDAIDVASSHFDNLATLGRGGNAHTIACTLSDTLRRAVSMTSRSR